MTIVGDGRLPYKSASDAPCHLNLAEAEAWASGWNAAAETIDESLGAFPEPTEADMFDAEFPGYQVRHDVIGFYICTDEEAEHEDAGNASVGFDGRQHWPSIAEAFHAFKAPEE